MNTGLRLLPVFALAFAGAAPLAAADPPTDLAADPFCVLPKCVNQRMAVTFSMEACESDCRRKRERLRGDLDACSALCAEARARAIRLALRACRGDGDGDGVAAPLDLCPSTLPFVAVNWMGCPDVDHDIIPDEKDRCPGTPPGAVVDLQGCSDASECEEGHCGTSPTPHCRTPQECNRLTEQPLPGAVPREALDRVIRRYVSRRAHPIACTGDSTPPDQPRLTSPAQGITPIEVGTVEVVLDNGQVQSGPSLPLRLAWNSVTDSCGPVTYSVYVEYYHCHDLGSLIEPATYRNRGWCRWVPYLYESIATTELAFDFPFGKVLYEVHSAFGPELGWDPHFSGPFPILYMPFWLRMRVIAHDGNGTASPFDLHADQRYVVLYPDSTVSLAALSQIPVAPP
ncbi:MAG TPA: hypothetical protein VF756_23610 [Thermoanaerobaculia bacterium]